MKLLNVLGLFVCLFVSLSVAQCGNEMEDMEMPSPWTRVLCYNSTTGYLMSGTDVRILQNLIIRCPEVSNSLSADGEYGQQTALAVSKLQSANELNPTGIFDSITADLLLSLYSCDGYKDMGIPASQYGDQYLFKLHFQVFRNRSYETMASLYDAQNVLQLQFRVRLHGFDNSTYSDPWPYFSSTEGLNMFTSDGNTPTGLSEADLNSPEPNSEEYGPYPVTRMINGIQGNAAFLLDPTEPVRTGILLHTGAWDRNSDWNPEKNMPDSEGCIHGHPSDIEQVWQKMVALGVVVHDNVGGEIPYPYQAQGLISVEQVGCQ